MMPLVNEIAGGNQVVKIQKLSILPAGSAGEGEPLARRAIAAAEQIRAATGVDLAEVLQRVGGGTHAPPPLPPAATKTKS
jgi:flotillin